MEYLNSCAHSQTCKTPLLKICITLGLTGTPFEERAHNPCPGTYDYNEQIQNMLIKDMRLYKGTIHQKHQGDIDDLFVSIRLLITYQRHQRV